MKKEFIKGLTMVTIIVVFAVASAVAANAQSSNQPANKVVANVPFDFSVGYKILPAGEYSVKTFAAGESGLLIESADEGTTVLRLSQAIEPGKNKAHARLVFRRYGERYFLAEVWNGADRTGRQLLRSQEETGVENEFASRAASLAATGSTNTYETVEVLAELTAKPR